MLQMPTLLYRTLLHMREARLTAGRPPRIGRTKLSMLRRTGPSRFGSEAVLLLSCA